MKTQDPFPWRALALYDPALYTVRERRYATYADAVRNWDHKATWAPRPEYDQEMPAA